MLGRRRGAVCCRDAVLLIVVLETLRGWLVSCRKLHSSTSATRLELFRSTRREQTIRGRLYVRNILSAIFRRACIYNMSAKHRTMHVAMNRFVAQMNAINVYNYIISYMSARTYSKFSHCVTAGIVEYRPQHPLSA